MSNMMFKNLFLFFGNFLGISTIFQGILINFGEISRNFATIFNNLQQFSTIFNNLQQFCNIVGEPAAGHCYYNNIASACIRGVLCTGLPPLESPEAQLSKNTIIFRPPCTVFYFWIFIKWGFQNVARAS